MGSPAEASSQCQGPAPPDAGLSRRAFLALIAAGAAGGVAGCSSGPDRPSYTFPEDALYYGASTPRENLTAFEARIGSRLSCHRSYFDAGKTADLHRQAAADLAVGTMPVVSIKPPGPWAATAANHLWIESLVGPLGDLRRQLFLCVHHEPENDGASYGSAADYVAMQEAVLDAAARLAKDVVIVPIMGTWSFDVRSARAPSEWNVHSAAVYGVDLYNPWSPTNGKDWVPFSDKLEMAGGEADGRPMLVGEYGCRPDPAQPGRAAAWMAEAFDAAIDKGVVAMSYFNSARNSPDGTWELGGETLSAFAELLRSPEVAWLNR
jgi:hypothetical protein